MAEINVVPYIDVMLVLLVIFMITAPLLTQGVKVELVEADARPVEEESKRPLVVSVEADGQWSITYDDDRTQRVDADELLQKGAAILQTNPGIPVLIKGDKNVAYDRVVQAMVILQQAGAPSVGLITQPPGATERPRPGAVFRFPVPRLPRPACASNRRRNNRTVRRRRYCAAPVGCSRGSDGPNSTTSPRRRRWGRRGRGGR